MKVDLRFGSCFDVLKNVRADIAFCDLPYGTTYAAWDKVFPLHHFWELMQQIVRPDGAIICTAQQPFTSLLVTSALNLFRCEWIWDKVNGTNFANAKRYPLKTHESVLVFSYQPSPRYFPIKTLGVANHTQGSKLGANKSATRLIERRVADDLSGLKYPKTIQVFPKHSSQCGLHPTQKPITLIDYFIRTYSAEGDLVVDPTMGSGSTGVAALAAGRRFVGAEQDEAYFQVAQTRLLGGNA